MLQKSGIKIGASVDATEENGVAMYFSKDSNFFEIAQDLITELAPAVGESFELDPGKITGAFLVVLERDGDGNPLIGLRPAAPINTDIVNAG